jgi:protein SCO1
MGTPQKILTTTLWCLTVLGMILFIALSTSKKRPEPLLAIASPNEGMPALFELPKFSLLDQDGREFTDQQLRGKPFVASFVFTHCAGPCPMMFAKMSAMQTTVPNPNVKLVTFTVDPERDTPAVLKKKAADMGAQEGKWFFLTGTKESIHKLLRDMLMPTPSPQQDPLMHTEQFYLFDAKGTCRGRYSTREGKDELAQLAKDAQLLAEQSEGKSP